MDKSALAKKLMTSKLLVNLLSGLSGAVIGAYSNKSIERRKEKIKIKISTFILYTDILSKINSVKESFKSCETPYIKIYSSSSLNYNYEQIEPYLMDLSHF